MFKKIKLLIILMLLPLTTLAQNPPGEQALGSTRFTGKVRLLSIANTTSNEGLFINPDGTIAKKTVSGGGSQNLQQVLENGSIGVLPGNVPIIIGNALPDNSKYTALEVQPEWTEMRYKDNSGINKIRFDNLGITFNMDGLPRLEITDLNTGFSKLPINYVEEDEIRPLMTDGSMIPSINKVQEMIGSKSINLWNNSITYPINQFVYKYINDQLYIFRSLGDNNNTEPLINQTKVAWSPPPYGGTYIGNWSAGSYVVGNIVNREGYLYYCLTNNSTDPKLLTPPDWLKLGIYAGVYSSIVEYDNGNVVTDVLNNVYLSNYNKNTYSLTKGVVSNWEVINGQPNTIVAWGDSLTFGAGSTGNGDWPSQFSLASGINVDNEGVPGETSTQIKARFMAAAEKHKYATIFMVGRNNYGAPETVKADLAEMISKLGHDRYLVIGIIKATTDGSGPIESLNTDLAALYPKNFINLQDYLYEIYNQSIPQDIADHVAGKIAWSLRSDWLHLNNLGYYYTSKVMLSKLGYLLGQDYSTFQNIETGGIRVTGNNPTTSKTEGLEIGYRKDLGKIFMDGRNRKTNELIDLSIGFSLGSTVKLAENGGRLFVGNITPYTTGDVNRLVVKTDTGEVEFAPSIGTSVIPFQNSAGGFGGTNLTYHGLELSVNSITPQAGYQFQVNGGTRLGNVSGLSLYMGEFNSNKTYIQSRTSTTQKDIQMFTNSLLLGNTDMTSTGERVQVDGDIKTDGIILHSPDGTRFRITVDNSGVLNSTVTGTP